MHGFFGEVIKGARTRRGLTLKQLAERIGLSDQSGEGQVSGWESGRRPVTERMIIKAAHIWGMTLTELFEEELVARGKAKVAAERKPTKEPHGSMINAGFLGECVRYARIGDGMTQEDLGARAVPPIQQPHIQAWEIGLDATMGEMSFDRLAAALDLTEEQIITRELVARGVLVPL